MAHKEATEIVKLFFKDVGFNNQNKESINLLHQSYDFNINDNVLIAELPEINLQKLLIELLKIDTPVNMIFEDLPVEETMRNFFQEPNKYLK